MLDKNPFPPKVIGADGKTEVPNQRYNDWQAGYAIGALDAMKAIFCDIPKALGVRLPIISDLFK